MKIKDITGNKYYNITVHSFAYTKNGQSYYYCICKCGKSSLIRRTHLLDGTTKSCGCYNKQRASKWLKKYTSSPAHKSTGNPQWKGERASYSSFHQWVARRKEKKQCEICLVKNKQFDLALMKGKKHAHNINNYMVLCRKCHWYYDNN